MHVIQYCLVNNLTNAVEARPDITMHQLSSGIRVKELRTNGIGIIAIVELAVTQKMA